MTIAPELAYAQARIQARFASLPTEEEWQRLAASRSLASFLEEARAGALRDWIKGFSGQSVIHDLEPGLRFLYREILDEVADWVPGPWREAVSWIHWLALLPLLAHLQAGGGMPDWAARDPALRDLLGGGENGAAGPPDPRVRRLFRQGKPLVVAWTEEWRCSWPACDRATSLDLESLAALLMDHAESFRRAEAASAWPLRRELRERLRLRFHKSTLSPVVPFVFLALTALDLERLRAALVGRALFPDWDEPAPSVAGRGSA